MFVSKEELASLCSLIPGLGFLGKKSVTTFGGNPYGSPAKVGGILLEILYEQE